MSRAGVRKSAILQARDGIAEQIQNPQSLGSGCVESPTRGKEKRKVSLYLSHELAHSAPNIASSDGGLKKNHLWINKKKNIKEVEAIKVLCMYADDDVILFSNDR